VIGAFLSKEDLGDLNALEFALEKNGFVVQHGNTASMLWKIDALIAYV
jgi:2-keto-4-pentenoate hydratase/2-oxohepta-3-ene-1,7-dioic acid hydratase in catechol pathway